MTCRQHRDLPPGYGAAPRSKQPPIDLRKFVDQTLSVNSDGGILNAKAEKLNSTGLFLNFGHNPEAPLEGLHDHWQEQPAPRLKWWWWLLVGLICGLAYVLLLESSRATWKPEFKDHSAALKSWFKNAKTTEWAEKQFTISYCCEAAERVKTKFDVVRGGEGIEQWWFQCTDDTVIFCTNRQKKTGEWAQIPPGIVHKEGIATPTEFPASDGSRGIVGEAEKTKVELEFQQLRAEGVLFVYRGDLVCFWPPQFQG